MALTSMPYLTIQELDANGNPYAGAKMFFYAAGTTTKQDTYADANGNSANTNPVVLDSAGRATVFFQPLTYDVVLAPSTDTDPPVSPIWTRSGIVAIPVSSANTDASGTAGEALSAGDTAVLSDGSGGKTAGKWYKGDADFTYLSSLAPQIGMVPDAIASGATGSIRIAGRITGLSGLTAGTLYYISATAGALTSSAPSNAKPIAVADSTTSVILQPPTPLASTTVPGLVSIGAQSIAGAKTFTALAAFSASATFVNSPLFAPGTLALGTMDSTVSGGFYKNVTSVGSSTGGAVSLTGDATVAANTLSANGKVVKFTAFIRTAANANNKQITVSYGGTNVFDSGVFTTAGAVNAIRIVCEIVRTGASSQRILTTYSISPLSAAGTYYSDTQSPGKDNTAAQIFKITAATAVANNDIVFDACFGETIG